MEKHYTDGTEPTILPHIHCSGPCEQGRKPCPAPDACERVDTSGGELEFLGAIVIAVLACAFAVLLVA
jgi:hypothetical protein